MKRALLIGLAFALSGCGGVSRMLGPRYDPQVVAAVHAKLKAKRFIAVAYEGVPGKDGRRMSVFKFEKSALLDRALVELRRTVADRALIQGILESQPLPDTGSFKTEDLGKIQVLSQADILLIGYSYNETKTTMMGEKVVPHVIIRAIDLRSREVVNSMEAEADNDADWSAITARLLYASEGV